MVIRCIIRRGDLTEFFRGCSQGLLENIFTEKDFDGNKFAFKVEPV